jgi:hypothetical protein
MLDRKDNHEAWTKIYNEKIQKINVTLNEDHVINENGIDLI